MFNSKKLQGLVNAAREILERPETSKNDPNSPRMLNETAKRHQATMRPNSGIFTK